MKREEILKDYDDKCKLHGEFLVAVESLFRNLLKQYSIKVHSIDSRIKNRRSLEGKLSKEDRNYEYLTDIKDICGLRVITYFIDQVDIVSSLISNEFNVDPKHSVNKTALTEPDRFGYTSVHYVVKLPERRLQLTEYRHFLHCEAEIQVRSILQHTWAELEHDLGYKSKNTLPRIIQRRFSRLASLLELADDEFVNIRDDLNGYENEIAEAISSNPDKVKVDNTSLLIYVKTSKLVEEVNKRIENETSIIIRKLSTHEIESTTLPRLKYLGFKTILDVDTALSQNMDSVINFAKKLVSPAVFNDEGYFYSDLCLFYLCYSIVASRGSLDDICAFVKKFIGKSEEEFAQFIYELR